MAAAVKKKRRSKFEVAVKYIIKKWNFVRKEYTVERLIFDPKHAWLMAVILFLVEIVVLGIVIKKINYTEIDWKAYMQEVEGVWNGTFDYSHLKGDTGPLVYPAGFVYIFLAFYFLTNHGSQIFIAQGIFAVLYLLTLYFVFKLYVKSTKIPPYALAFMCCTSYRIHSIYVLRLFNDPVAMILFYASLHCFLSNRWKIGCTLYSAAVSVKMNILLFAPALWLIMLAACGFKQTVINIVLCGLIQVVLGLPFLLSNPVSYISRSFNLGRVFLYQWTVNWRLIPEEIFLSHYFHIALLLLHIVVLIAFMSKWYRLLGLSSLFPSSSKKMKLVPYQIILPMFTANFIGMTFSRSLHYQFYVWYFHSLPFLLWFLPLPRVSRLFILGLIELAWNTYPSTIWSSGLLHACHLVILAMLWWRPNPEVDNLKKE